jgi:hypothetical protein
MTPAQPMTPGAFYLMRRKCGKASCRCAQGQLHPASNSHYEPERDAG